MSASVDSVNLSDNRLSKLSSAEWEEANSGFRANVRSLDVSFNGLEDLSGTELKAFFSSFSEHINFVDVSYNYLGNKTGSELKEGFSGFRANITSVRLSNNEFAKQNSGELKKAFSGFLPTVTRLDFSYDKLLRRLNTEQLVAFLQSIPKPVKFIDLSHCKLFKGKTLEERDALLVALRVVDPDGSRLNLAHNGDSTIARAMAPMIEPVKQEILSREVVNTILHKPVLVSEKMVSQYSFFSQPNPVREKQAEACDHSLEPPPTNGFSSS